MSALEPGLSPEAGASRKRYQQELLQGEAIAEGLEGEAWGWSGPAGTLRAVRRAEFLIEKSGLKPGVTCLELGCGTGAFTARLAESGCVLTAVELSPVTAEICRKRLSSKAEIILGNIETGEGLEGRSFDAIVGVSVLHHLNMQLCLKNTFSKLKNGGRFAFSEPNMANPQIWAERHIGWIKKLRHVTPHETAFYAGELRGLFENAGLAVDICEPFEFLHPATPAALIGSVRFVERILEKLPTRRMAGSIRVVGRKP